MRRALCTTSVLLCLVACMADTSILPATQVTLRIDLSPTLQANARSLRVRVATQESKIWTESGTRTLTLEGLALPIDVPVIPGAGAPRDQTFEAVIEALGQKGSVLAQARVITQFVPHEQRVLEVSFGPCGSQALGDLCESQPNCHGSSCKTCVSDACGDTPVIAGSDLEPLQPNRTPEPTEWTQDPVQEECNADARRCDGLMSQVCDDQSTWQDEKRCIDLCQAGSCITVPSCKGALKCGDNESCCDSELVPGGSFSRSYDRSADFSDDSFEATVSPFRLDRFEVTVGRFRSWRDVYDTPGSRPKVGTGRNVNDVDDLGWQAEWSSFLPRDAEALEARFATCEGADASTWSYDVSRNDLPINCVDWYTALAFCIWDGGRLPTEAEWNFAAAGGVEQRVFPWSDPPSLDTIDGKHAVFNGAPVASVGSKSPLGDARWGQADLAGNVYEWTYDWYMAPYPTAPCNDCSNLFPSETRARRGGSSRFLANGLRVSERGDLPPDVMFSDSGFRCAR